MRLFLAVNLSDDMKNALVSAQKRMYDSGIRGNYTKEENLHLTLAFIGEYPDSQAVMDAAAEVEFTDFPLTLEGMGCFGTLWWAGMKASAPLNALVRRLRKTLEEHQIPFDKKRFSPHITLIRKASGDMPAIQMDSISMTVDTISLMRSERGKNGMIYTEIGSRKSTV